MHRALHLALAVSLAAIATGTASNAPAQSADAMARVRSDFEAGIADAVADARRFEVGGVWLGMPYEDLARTVGLASDAMMPGTGRRVIAPDGTEMTVKISGWLDTGMIVAELQARLPDDGTPLAEQLDAATARFGQPDETSPMRWLRYGDKNSGEPIDAMVAACNANAAQAITARDLLRTSVRTPRRHLPVIAQTCPDAGAAYRGFVAHQARAEATVTVVGSERAGNQHLMLSASLPATKALEGLAKF